MFGIALSVYGARVVVLKQFSDLTVMHALAGILSDLVLEERREVPQVSLTV